MAIRLRDIQIEIEIRSMHDFRKSTGTKLSSYKQNLLAFYPASISRSLARGLNLFDFLAMLRGTRMATSSFAVFRGKRARGGNWAETRNRRTVADINRGLAAESRNSIGVYSDGRIDGKLETRWLSSLALVEARTSGRRKRGQRRKGRGFGVLIERERARSRLTRRLLALV